MQIHCVHNIHNSTVLGRGGLFMGFVVLFSSFSTISIFKGVQVIKGQKLKIRIISSVTMLKHNILYKRCY